MRFIALAPKALDDLLRAEMLELGLRLVGQTGTRIAFEGELEDAYRVIMHSRVASRVVLELAAAPVDSPDDIYELTCGIDWGAILKAGMTFSVDFRGLGAGIRNSRFGAQRVKDGIVDHFRTQGHSAPDVDLSRPDLGVHVHLRSGSEVSIGFDLGGGPLHRRGYRRSDVEAPLKENVAAGLLMRCGWSGENTLVDPLCGSGTVLIEGALIAFSVAPGLGRPRGHFGRWLGHDKSVWEKVRAEAKAMRQVPPSEPRFFGGDIDGQAIEFEARSVDLLGLTRVFSLEQKDALDWRKPSANGWLVSNLPYGRRLEQDETELRSLEEEFDVYVAANISEAEEVLKNESVDVMVTDLRLGGESGMDLITKALARSKPPVCILMTAYGSVDVAVEAMKKGAYDYVSKPLNIDELEIVIKRAIRSRSVEEENVALKAQVDDRYGIENIIGRSEPMRNASVSGNQNSAVCANACEKVRRIVRTSSSASWSESHCSTTPSSARRVWSRR